VVDSFEALTSDRPYHRARSRADALEILQQEAGVALDPRIVAAFIELLPALEAEAERQGEPEPAGVLRRARALRGHEADAADPASCVFTDIALAHREIYKLYQIAQAMGTSLGVVDTMAMLAAKLRELVPFSTCALFLPGEDEGLRCAFADGEAAEALLPDLGAAIQGLVGWVARNRRVRAGAAAALDFEAGCGRRHPPLEAALVSPLVVATAWWACSPSTTCSRGATPKTTGGCSSASANRRQACWPTRCCSSRPAATRSPIR
jgi:hypothetical protein